MGDKRNTSRNKYNHKKKKHVAVFLVLALIRAYAYLTSVNQAHVRTVDSLRWLIANDKLEIYDEVISKLYL